MAGRLLEHLDREDLADTPVPPAPEVEALLHQLVTRLSGSGNGNGRHGGAHAHAPEVILDVEVEGIRCLMVRLPKPDDAHATLSPREHEIARMVAKGYANKTIAAVLDISCWTVGTYLRRIFAKLGVSSRAAMVAQLHEGGLLPEPYINGAAGPSRRR